MKHFIYHTGLVFVMAASLLCLSCDDFLSTIPKGEKIPRSWDDFNAFIYNDEAHLFDNVQQLTLLNDMFKTPSHLNNYPLTKANYMWDENEDRYPLDDNVMFSSNTPAYQYGYQGIYYWNLILDNVSAMTECTAEQREIIKAQAKVLRVMHYFHVANYYADQYTKEKAATTLSVPLVTSGTIEAPSPQVSLAQLYEFMISELDETTLESLPLQGETLYHPTKASGYGMLARICLSMSDYTNALKYAQKALDINHELYNWREYYEENKSLPTLSNPTISAPINPNVTKTNPENYVFAYSCSYSKAMKLTNSFFNIPLERAGEFEPGDVRLMTKWKYWKYSSYECYRAINGDFFNGGGMSSPEMYYIKAECLARQNQLGEAMDVLNTVRETRILAENYTPRTAGSLEEAIRYIIQDKANEYLQTSIPFWDMRRLNKEGKYAKTFRKTVGGITYELKPDSHLWIMPFSEKTVATPGNNPITQNTPR